MPRLNTSGWRIRKLLPGSMSRPNSDLARAVEDIAVVRLIVSPHRLPATPLEHRVVSTLKRAGAVSFGNLVKMVADDLYAEELQKGSGVLDIGLFGSRLFNVDIVRELNTGNGILWKIESERKSL